MLISWAGVPVEHLLADRLLQDLGDVVRRVSMALE
jgi:hypothetical protein